MSDASDVQHHLEEGLLLFSRGLVFEARESWRKALQIEPTNPVGLDYLSSTERELNPYDRQREAEALRATRGTARPKSGAWEDDEYEVIAAGPADDDEDTLSGATPSITGFLVPDEERRSEAAAARPAQADNPQATTGWVTVPDDEDTDWKEDEWEADSTPRPGAVEEYETGPAEESEEDMAAAFHDEITPPHQEILGPAHADDSSSSRKLNGAPVPAVQAHSRSEGGEEWEPLAWMNEDTPAVAGRSPGAGNGSPADQAALAEEAPRPFLAELFSSAEPASISSGHEATPEPATGSGSAGSAPLAAASTASAAPPPAPRKEAPPSRESVIESLMVKAGQELLEGHREAARALLVQVLELEPGHKTAQQYLKRVNKELMAHYQEVLGDSDGVPVLNRPLEELFTLELDPAGGYLLSRIDGVLTLDDIYTLSAHLDKQTMMRILVELIESGVVSIRR